MESLNGFKEATALIRGGNKEESSTFKIFLTAEPHKAYRNPEGVSSR